MSEQLPPQDFNGQQYARPNQNWICGRAAEGKPCRVGPDGRGRCQATFECKPVLEIKPGETKGRWRCTRIEGICENGPLPDGTCCRPIPKCSPAPTLRLQRGRLTRAVVVASFALLLIVLGAPPLRNRFINPGEVSRSHSGAAFAALAATNHLAASCGACHRAGTSGPVGMVHVALHAKPGMFDISGLATAKEADVTAIDESCEKCHTGHSFHQPDVAAISCTFCHQEHRGATIAKTTDANCNFCHGNATMMQQAATAGRNLPADAFRPQASGRLTFIEPRPASGFTETIHHFADDHPQFRFIADNLRDPDTLKFNHELHLTGKTIPKLPNGQKLDCAFCHQPDASGTFMKPVNFERNCRVCHSLQFDPQTPELRLPHGSAEFVSAFLRSLPKQYTDLAEKEKVADVDGFVQAKLAGLRSQFGSGEALEKRVFFSTATIGPEEQMGTVSGATRALFPGCAYCHEVKSSASGSPEITKPVIFERWLAHAEFNHAKHTGIACERCHDAVHSTETSDILLPGKATCVTCHSPKGGVADTCAECHVYHKPQIAER